MLEELSIRSPLNQAPIFFTPVTTSTMDEAASLAEAGTPTGTVVMADYQEQGRGRRQSGVWEANPGENLLFTLILPKDPAPGGLLKTPLLLGLSVAAALENSFALPAKIKWPNDVTVAGKKLSGILCQARAGALLAGIGINCNQRRFSHNLSSRAGSLALILGRDVDRRALLVSVLEAFVGISANRDWRGEIEKRLLFLGERRAIIRGGDREGERLEGVVAGLGEYGELLVRLPESGKIERLVSGSLV